MSPPLFNKKKKGVAITRELYEREKRRNGLYSLKSKLSHNDRVDIFTNFSTPESFLKDSPLDERGKEVAENLMKKLVISREQAGELALAKGLGCPLYISDRQLWMTKIAGKAGIKTKVYR